MSKSSRIVFLIGAVIVLPVAGYGIAHALALLFPMSERTPVSHLTFVTILILGLLAVPYWMLKLGAHAAHEINPEEKEMELKDIPKDQDDLNRS